MEKNIVFYSGKVGGFLGRGCCDVSRALGLSSHVTGGSDTRPSAGLPWKLNGLGAPARKDSKENESILRKYLN